MNLHAIKNKLLYNRVMILIIIFIIITILFVALIHLTQIPMTVKEGVMDAESKNPDIIYLQGDWKMREGYLLPNSSQFNDAKYVNINNFDSILNNTQTLNNTEKKHFSFQTKIQNINTKDYYLSPLKNEHIKRIYVDNKLVFDANAKKIIGADQGILLNETVEANSLMLTTWLEYDKSVSNPELPVLFLLISHTSKLNVALTQMILKYLVIGIYCALSLISLLMYLKNKSYQYLLLLALSIIFRIIRAELLLYTTLIPDHLGISAELLNRFSNASTFISGTIITVIIFIVYRKYFHKGIGITLISVIIFLLLLQTFNSHLPLFPWINLLGFFLFLLCLLAIGRAFCAKEKNAGLIFAAFYIYMNSLLLVYASKPLINLNSTLGVYNIVGVLGELSFYIVFIFSFFNDYTDNYAENILRIQALDKEIINKEDYLQEAYNKLQLFEQNRTKMLRNFAHDLKTPITSILGYLSMMEQGEISDPQEVKEFAGRMLLRIRQIGNMSNNLSALVTLEGGYERINIKPVLISDLLTVVKNNFRQKCTEAQINFFVEDSSDFSIMVDETQIIRVFDNLINNAIQYTDTGGEITVKAVDIGEYLRFSVSDTGCGIPDNVQSQVFERFYRAEQSRHDSGKHQGLGLAICYEIVKIHEGTIGVNSKTEKGSEFYFILKKMSHKGSLHSDE